MLQSYLCKVMESLAWEAAPHLAVAVSGGADSMALALLMQRWAAARGGHITALVVDHGLRPESADEAQQTIAWLAQYGIEGHVLSLALATSPHAVQERARDARYDALSAWCRQHEVLHLLTGHHMGDQAETMLFRLTRASGLSGLAAMPLVREQGGIRLIRPLLGASKASLEDYLRERGQPWAHDPSNDQTRFTRIQFRQMFAPLPCDTSLRCASLAQGFGQWRQLHERQLNHALCQWVKPIGSSAVQVSQRIATLPRSWQRDLWQAVLDCVGNQSTPPRGAALERLMERLAQQPRDALHGCEIVADTPQNVWVVRKIMAGNLEETHSRNYIKTNAVHASENHVAARDLPLKPLAHAPFSAMNRFL